MHIIRTATGLVTPSDWGLRIVEQNITRPSNASTPSETIQNYTGFDLYDRRVTTV